MDTALYYTFSTIAQALAAAMALLAAIAMYRLKGIDDESVGAAALIERTIGGGTWLQQHFLVSHWSKTIAVVGDRIVESQASAEVVALGNKLRQLRGAADAIRRALWTALIATALVMGASVTALAYVPAICGAGTARQALGFGVAGFLACLVTYCWLIWESVRATKE